MHRPLGSLNAWQVAVGGPRDALVTTVSFESRFVGMGYNKQPGKTSNETQNSNKRTQKLKLHSNDVMELLIVSSTFSHVLCAKQPKRHPTTWAA